MAETTFDTKRIAHLSRLHLTIEDEKMLQDEIERILTAIEPITHYDTSDIEPLTNPLETLQPYREDVVTESCQRQELQKLAPDVRNGLYIVPLVISKNDA